MKPNLRYVSDRRPKKNISASDAEKLGIDIILSLNGVEESNPKPWNDYLRTAAGKGVELEMIKVLKQNGIVDEDYDQDTEWVDGVGEDGLPFSKEQPRDSTKVERNGVTISMRFDAEVKKGGAKISLEKLNIPSSEVIEMLEGEPIEIKSVNNKNSFDIQKYKDGNPRSNYVKQLAIYMDALGKEQGHLFVATIDGLHTFWFTCRKVGEGLYKCGNVEVDLNLEYARFAEIYADSKRVWDVHAMRKWWNEEQYKIPLKDVKWAGMSVTEIGNIRNGRKVVGTEGKFKIDYSGYKDLIIRMQGHTLGYTGEELAEIRDVTEGFSAKPKAEPKE